MKRLVAIALAICLLSSLFVFFASAADARGSYWVTQCTTNFVSVRKEKVDGVVLGYMMKGEFFCTNSSKGADWYEGYPEAGSSIYDVPEYTYPLTGYVRSSYFSTENIQSINDAVK